MPGEELSNFNSMVGARAVSLHLPTMHTPYPCNSRCRLSCQVRTLLHQYSRDGNIQLLKDNIHGVQSRVHGEPFLLLPPLPVDEADEVGNTPLMSASRVAPAQLVPTTYSPQVGVSIRPRRCSFAPHLLWRPRRPSRRARRSCPAPRVRRLQRGLRRGTARCGRRG
jgi:hypothetical protein